MAVLPLIGGDRCGEVLLCEFDRNFGRDFPLAANQEVAVAQS